MNASITNSTRHPDLWFDDGSIILHVETTLFRVHRSTLSTHSEVFADMFRIPQPPDHDIIEGCSVVHLPDSANDFIYLLKALYDPLYVETTFFSKPNKDFVRYFSGTQADPPIPFDAIAGILRLSNKYDIPPIRRRCIHELRRHFPCTLAAFDATILNAPPLSTLMPTKAIILARECNALDILPCAFYLLCQAETEAFLDILTLLPQQEIRTCLLGRERLRVVLETATLSFALNPNPSPTCTDRAGCRPNGLEFLSAAISQRIHAGFYALEKNNVDKMLNDHLCYICTEDRIFAHIRGREKVWNELPGYFGLGTWEALRAN